MTASDKPILWHPPHSHYSEKARWALAWKGVEHVRKAPPPGAHMAVAAWLTRGAHVTLPVLELDGEHIGDSTAIIGALEARYPEPALYPEDPATRRRALDLEDFFDEGLGPAARLFAFHHARGDRERLGALALELMPAPVRRLPGARGEPGCLRRPSARSGFGSPASRPRPPRARRSSRPATASRRSSRGASTWPATRSPWPT